MDIVGFDVMVYGGHNNRSLYVSQWTMEIVDPVLLCVIQLTHKLIKLYLQSSALVAIERTVVLMLLHTNGCVKLELCEKCLDMWHIRKFQMWIDIFMLLSMCCTCFLKWIYPLFHVAQWNRLLSMCCTCFLKWIYPLFHMTGWNRLLSMCCTCFLKWIYPLFHVAQWNRLLSMCCTCFLKWIYPLFHVAQWNRLWLSDTGEIYEAPTILQLLYHRKNRIPMTGAGLMHTITENSVSAVLGNLMYSYKCHSLDKSIKT